MGDDARAEAEAEADHELRAQRFARYVACESEKPHIVGCRPVAQMVQVLSLAASVNFKFIREKLKLNQKGMKAYMKLTNETLTDENLRVEALLAEFVANYLKGEYDDDVRQMPVTSLMKTSDEIGTLLAKLDRHPNGFVPWSARKKRIADLNSNGKRPSSHVMPGAEQQRAAAEWHGNGASPRESYDAEQQSVAAEQRFVKRAKRHEGPTWWRLCEACDETFPSKEGYHRHLNTAFHRAADELHKAGTPMRTWSALRVDKATGELLCVPTGRKPKTYEEWEQHRRSDEYWFAVTAADPRYKSKIIDRILE